MVFPQHRIRILAIGCYDDTLKRVSNFCASGPYFKLIGFVLEGRFAAELCKILNPDVTLLDASVDMNNVDVLKAVREVLPTAILMMLSAATDQDLLRTWMDAGMSNVLTKPLDEAEFVSTIRVTYERNKP